MASQKNKTSGSVQVGVGSALPQRNKNGSIRQRQQARPRVGGRRVAVERGGDTRPVDEGEIVNQTQRQITNEVRGRGAGRNNPNRVTTRTTATGKKSTIKRSDAIRRLAEATNSSAMRSGQVNTGNARGQNKAKRVIVQSNAQARKETTRQRSNTNARRARAEAKASGRERSPR